MGFPLRELAMKLLFLQIIALTVGEVFNLTPNEDQVAPALKVAHFDCSDMTKKYSLRHKSGTTMPNYAWRIGNQ